MSGTTLDKNDGGPAFPMREERTEQISKDVQMVTPGEWPGMTLRDYFAAKALPILREGLSAEYLAQRAYEIADAMLAERDR